MNALIVGGGKVGSHLAARLHRDGHTVTVVEMNSQLCQMLGERIPEVTVICGDGDEPYILDSANIRNADAVVAATGDDEDNLVVCLLAKIEYDVPLTIARINNPANEWLFTKRFGVDEPVSNTAIMVELLDRCVEGEHL